MSFLLSTGALIDLVTDPVGGAVARWIKTLAVPVVECSVISIGHLRAQINALDASDARKPLLEANLDQAESNFKTYSYLRDVTPQVAKSWSSIAHLNLTYNDGSSLGVECRLVAATALANNMIVVTQAEPWTQSLAPHGLKIATPSP